MNAQKAWIMVGGVLVIVAITAFLAVWLIHNVLAETVSPIQQTSRNLQTQIAQVLHPTPTVMADPVTIVHEVQTLARLETIQYTEEKVITAENGQEVFRLLFGDRLIFVAHGVVIAGVDLQKLASRDVWTQGRTVYIRLPATEVFSSSLDNQKSYVYNRETGILTRGDVNLETTARRAAEGEILKAALEDGILAQAQANAEIFIDRFLRNLGYSDVIIIQATPEPPD